MWFLPLQQKKVTLTTLFWSMPEPRPQFENVWSKEYSIFTLRRASWESCSCKDVCVCLGWHHARSLGGYRSQRTVRLMNRWPIKLSSLMPGERGAAVLLLFLRFALPPPSLFSSLLFPRVSDSAGSNCFQFRSHLEHRQSPQPWARMQATSYACASQVSFIKAGFVLAFERSVRYINSVLWQQFFRARLKASPPPPPYISL